MTDGAGTKKKGKERGLTTAAEFDRRLDRINEALDREILLIEKDRKRSEEAWRRNEEAMLEMRRKTEAAAEEERRKTEAAVKAARLETEEAVKAARLETTESLRRLQEAQLKTQEQLDRADGNFNRKWGEFMENLVGGDLKGALAGLGIRAGRVVRRRIVLRRSGKTDAEYDLVAEAGDTVVAVEVKTTLEREDVEEFLKALSRFRERFPEYEGKKVLGAVAFLATDAARDADVHPPGFLADPAVRPALEAGLFVIRSPGGGPGPAVAENPGGFVPREF